MEAWEQEMAAFEINCAKRVDEDAKILAEVDHGRDTLR